MSSSVTGLGLLPVPDLAGYFLPVQLKPFRYRMLRESGQHVVLRSALTEGIWEFLAQPIGHPVRVESECTVNLI